MGNGTSGILTEDGMLIAADGDEGESSGGGVQKATDGSLGEPASVVDDADDAALAEAVGVGRPAVPIAAAPAESSSASQRHKEPATASQLDDAQATKVQRPHGDNSGDNNDRDGEGGGNAGWRRAVELLPAHHTGGLRGIRVCRGGTPMSSRWMWNVCPN